MEGRGGQAGGGEVLRHQVSAGDGRTWKQERHSWNVGSREREGAAGVGNWIWNDATRAAHDELVAGEDEHLDPLRATLRNSIRQGLWWFPEGRARVAEEAVWQSTYDWLSRVVPTRFWRLTSNMGLDFFVARKTPVRFVREESEPRHLAPRSGALAITSTEWEHALRMGYLWGRRGAEAPVTRVEPLLPPAGAARL